MALTRAAVLRSILLGTAVGVLTVSLGASCNGPTSNNEGDATRPAPGNSNSAASAPSGNDNAAAPAGRASDQRRRYPLDGYRTTDVAINTHSFRVWLALTSGQQQEGLMFVPESEILDDQGMLFVFAVEQPLSFWMANTITPLDIAYARTDGTIVKIRQMAPNDTHLYPSEAPARYALEVKQGTLERLGIREGDRLILPSELLKRNP